MELIDGVRDALGGGTLSIWMLLGGAVALWLAWKAVVTTVRLALVAGAAFLLLGVVPWSGEPIEGAEADCAAAAVVDANAGVLAALTKRVTVEELSQDATCDRRGRLASGTATVRTRTWADLPLRTWTATPDGAVAG